MATFNKVVLLGNLTRDVELKGLPSGSSVANWGMAVNRKWKDQAGNKKDETCFVDCACFGKSADTIAQYVKKGDPLLIEGRLKFDQWQDQSGGKRSKLSVVVENFQFLGERKHGAPTARNQGGPEFAPVGSDDADYF